MGGTTSKPHFPAVGLSVFRYTRPLRPKSPGVVTGRTLGRIPVCYMHRLMPRSTIMVTYETARGTTHFIVSK